MENTLDNDEWWAAHTWAMHRKSNLKELRRLAPFIQKNAWHKRKVRECFVRRLTDLLGYMQPIYNEWTDEVVWTDIQVSARIFTKKEKKCTYSYFDYVIDRKGKTFAVFSVHPTYVNVRNPRVLLKLHQKISNLLCEQRPMFAVLTNARHTFLYQVHKRGEEIELNQVLHIPIGHFQCLYQADKSIDTLYNSIGFTEF